VNQKKLLRKLVQGDFNNISFADIVRLIEAFGFKLSRTSGSHHIFTHSSICELLNIQEVKGEAKPYQIRQLLKLVERYNLNMEEKDD